MARYEFHAYHGDAAGNVATKADVTTHEYEDRSAAKAYAGRLAKRINGPVDLAREGDGEWCERYLTTAEPNEYTSTGYSFGRVE